MHADRLRNGPGRAADVSARPKVGSVSEAVPACTGAILSTSGAYRRVPALFRRHPARTGACVPARAGAQKCPTFQDSPQALSKQGL